MCGIVGYLGREKATDIIISGLEKLEYRGYDSCGICFYDEAARRFVMYKDKGRVAHLKNDFDYHYSNNLGSAIRAGQRMANPIKSTRIRIFLGRPFRGRP